MIKRIAKRAYMLLIRLKRRDCRIEPGVEFGKRCRFEGHNLLSRGTYLRNVSMGFGSYTGDNCFLRSTRIGRYSCLGPNVIVAIGRHPTHDFVSIHPAFFSVSCPVGFSFVSRDKFEEVKFAIDDGRNRYCVDIGNDVWIGANATIVDGVTVGDGAVIAAGSVVVNDVAPYSIVGGIPAREIRKRFSDKDIERLMRVKWWEWDNAFIAKNAECFESMEAFSAVFTADMEPYK